MYIAGLEVNYGISNTIVLGDTIIYHNDSDILNDVIVKIQLYINSELMQCTKLNTSYSFHDTLYSKQNKRHKVSVHGCL